MNIIRKDDGSLPAVLERYQASVQLKDRGLLYSSLAKRREATAMAERFNSPGLRAICKANEATLLGYHIGDGIAALAAAKEALADPELFAAADKVWHDVTGLVLLHDMLSIIRQWSESYDEYRAYSRLYADHFPNEMTEKNFAALEEARHTTPEWGEFQLGLAYRHFSRESPELDRGAYCSGMSVLQCALSRALAGQSGYNIDYEHFEHALDDYVVISHQHFNQVLLKYQAAHGMGTNPGDHRELSVILDEPLRIWNEFMPDMREVDKEKFSGFFQAFWLDLAMLHAQDKTDPLARYFPEVFIPCPECGERIPRQSPICRYCGKRNSSFMLPKSTQGSPDEFFDKLGGRDTPDARAKYAVKVTMIVTLVKALLALAAVIALLVWVLKK